MLKNQKWFNSFFGVTLAALVAFGGSGCATTGGAKSGGSAGMAQRMGWGWNLGNTLEACDINKTYDTVREYETLWGNPQTTPEMIQAIRKAGFRSIRIPVAWSNLLGDNYQINADLMDRVETVVGWALDADLIVVMNIHWDGGWWTQFAKDEKEAMRRYTTLWTQIAERFKNHSHDLIFESLNEEACFNDIWERWGKGTQEQKKQAFDLANRINQTFVDLVRESGGKNKKRHLLIAGYCTDIKLTMDPAFKMPKDPAGRSMVSVHYYDPFGFTHLQKDESWAKMRKTWGTEQDIKDMKATMAKLKTHFVDKGVPVVVGEYGSDVKNKDLDSVRRYILEVGAEIRRLGMVPMLWDPGYHFNRKKLEFNDPKLAEGLAAATKP